MKKKLFATLMCLIMVVAMAVPAFAAPPPVSESVWIYNSANIAPNLNAASNSVPTNLTNVTMWAMTQSDTQRWDVKLIDSTHQLYNIRSYANTAVGLNIYRDGSNNCNLYSVASNSYNDKTIKCVEEAGGVYGLVLPAYTLCLTPTGFSNGANVNWQAPNNQTNQLWRIRPNK